MRRAVSAISACRSAAGRREEDRAVDGIAIDSVRFREVDQVINKARPRGDPVEFDVHEASIAELRAALEDGLATSEQLVLSYLERIDAYDAPGTATALNAVVVRNPEALAEARV